MTAAAGVVAGLRTGVGHPRGDTTVPWSTVVPLAVGMCLVDGFWATSVRTAVGAIEHTRSPFAHWLAESALLLPGYVCAVLAAVAYAAHRFGPAPGRAGTAVTALLVAVSGAGAGTALLVWHAVQDYRSQVDQLRMMAFMSRTSDGILATQERASLQLQVKAVAVGAVLLLVTNVVLLAWTIALRGGRLQVATARRPASGTLPRVRGQGRGARWSRTRVSSRSRADDLRTFLVLGLLATAALHAVVVPAHVAEWPAAGVFFVVLAVAECAVAERLFTRREVRAPIVLAAAVSLGPLLLWAWSRLTGLPFGPEPGVAEPVGLTDAAVAVLEIATLLIAGRLIAAALVPGSRREPGEPPVSSHAAWLAVTALVAVTAVGAAGSLPGLSGEAGHHALSAPGGRSGVDDVDARLA